ncbi:MAG: lytic transglycosylase domain-containing protein [Pseudomonadota bacterium]
MVRVSHILGLAALALLVSCGPLPPFMGGPEPDPRVVAASGKGKKKAAVAKTTGGKKHKVRRAESLKTASKSKDREERCEKLRPLIDEIAAEHGLEPELIMGVIKVESSFNEGSRSRVGAQGLMQIMPGTARHMKCSNVWEAENNIRCGCKVLSSYLKRYDGNLIYGLAAYNAGPGNVNAAAKEKRLPFNFSYPERVLRWRNLYRKNGCM